MTLLSVFLAAACAALAIAYAHKALKLKALAIELTARTYQCEELRRLSSLQSEQLTSHNALRKVLSGHAGGIGKRISECREIAHAIEKHSPELYEHEHGLIYWLVAMDQFLIALFKGYDPREPDRSIHTRMAEAYTSDVYRHVHARMQSHRPPTTE